MRIPTGTTALSWILLSMTLLKGSEVNAADIVTSCPEYFEAGQINIITCTVNTTSIKNAKCYPSPTNIDLQLTYSSGLLRRLCSSPYPNTSCTQGDCFCADQSGDLLTYQFKIVADSTYEGGNFTCNICEVPTGINPQRVISSNCSAVKFVTTTTTTTTTTAAVTTTVTKSTSEAVTTTVTKSTSEVIVTGPVPPYPPDHLVWWLILIIVVGAIGLLASLILVIFTVWFWNPDYLTRKVWWLILLMVLACICILGIIIVVIILLKWKEKLCFKKKEVSPPRQSPKKNGQRGDPKEGKTETNSTSQSSKTTDSEKTGNQHVASGKSLQKEHRTREETSLDLSELNSGSATSEESAPNIVTHRQLRPLPTPNLTSVERNSSVDPFRQTNPLPEISGRLKQ